MRRSAAPSQQQAAKRPRFAVPYKSGYMQMCNTASLHGAGRNQESKSKVLDGEASSFSHSEALTAGPPEHGKYVSSVSAVSRFTCSTGNSVLNDLATKKPEYLDTAQTPEEETKLSVSPTNSSLQNECVMQIRSETCPADFHLQTVDIQKSSRDPLKPFNIAKKFQSPLTARRPQSANGRQATGIQNVNLSSVKTGSEIPGQDECVKTCYFSVVWCKLSKKKHKKWEGDAVLLVQGRRVTLYDMEGKEIGKGSGYKSSELESLKEDETLVVGGKEIQIMSEMSEEQFKSGKCFSGAGSVRDEAPVSSGSLTGLSKSFINPLLAKKGVSEQNSRMPETARPQAISPRFDPSAPNALVMPRPSSSHQGRNKRHTQIVDVVVDPHLAVNLRPHQREGVVFLYECVMGMCNYGGTGAILADDMGLGKTLQCITLIWTLLKQGPYGGKPAVKRALIITPGSLVKNWSQEFRKWLGVERLQVFIVAGDSRVEDYLKTAVYPVMIISYEMFVRGYEVVKEVPFDLVVCDEGHRLKNTAIKTTSLIMSLNTRRRIVLSGTPIQNDLQEFFSVVDFCNPGVLGSSAAFRRVYEEPILASRQPGASREEIQLGEERASELARLTRMFVLRRTQEINNKYLPPKVELVLFCHPSPRQTEVYREILRSSVVRSCLLGRGCGAGIGAGSLHLLAIAALKQVCNHPALLANKVKGVVSRDADGDVDVSEDPLFSGLVGLYPSEGGLYPSEGAAASIKTEDSGKLAALAQILENIFSSNPKEKVVLVSNHTKTLDLLQQFCKEKDYSWLRLDGQTPTSQRHKLVTRFNSTYGQEKIFLLSSKAGGVGLNLVGASRLFLFDIDWNPANDLQAMARVWRDGQRKQVYIYRLLTTGSIEEKVYQRQISKQGLSGAVMDLKASDIQFSQEDLKDLFSFSENCECETHSLLGCQCDCEGGDKDQVILPPAPIRSCQLGSVSAKTQARNLSMAELLDWQHLRGSSAHLKKEWGLCDTHAVVSFLFWHKTQASESDAQ